MKGCRCSWIFVALLLRHASASLAPRVPDALEKPSVSSNPNKRLTEETMTQNIRKMEYAVRGKIVIAAEAIKEELKQEDTDHYDFDKIVMTNIGNPQSMGQKPLTWPRQVMALVDLPSEMGVDHPEASKLFPPDAIERAREIKKALAHGSSGAYSHSKGVKLLRDDVVQFLQRRDGAEVEADAENIYLTNGASSAIVLVLSALIADSTW